MALNIIPNPPTALTTDTDWTTFVSRSGYGMIGHGLSIPIFTLTEWDSGTALEPEIAVGSIIEVGGSFYQADSDTALTADTGLSDGVVRIKLVPASGGATVVPTLTSDALPAWDSEKGGWYDSNDKFLPHVMNKSGTSYTAKGVFIDQDAQIEFFVNGSAQFQGDLVADGSLTVGSGGIFGGAMSIGGSLSVDGDILAGSDLSMTGSILPKTPATYGSITVAANTDVTIPRGVYLFSGGPARSSGDNFALIGTFDGSISLICEDRYTSLGDTFFRYPGGVVFSDGVNVAFRNSGDTASIDYIKF